MSTAASLPAARRATPAGWLLSRVVWRTRVVGAENMPADGPVIIAANHTGVIDGPIVFGVSPRPVHMMIKESMFRGPIGSFLRWSGQIPVDRENGRPALAAALSVLKRGDVVGIFPEGRRGRGDLSEVRGGVAWLALASGAPVVPAAVLGTRRTGEGSGRLPGFRRRLFVLIGEPVTMERAPGTTGKQAQEQYAQLVASALKVTVEAAVELSGIALPLDDPGAVAPGGGSVVQAD
ncbi:lysophospholipid acyltransferase family protein [Sanguibacter hominis]